MDTMSSSPPLTPTHRPTSSHRRRRSSVNMSYHTPSRRQSFNRPSSGYSNITPRSSRSFDNYGSPMQPFGAASESNRLGNLADELGDWSEDDEEGIEGDYGEESDLPDDEGQEIGMAVEHDGSSGIDSSGIINGVRDSGVAMHSSSPSRLAPKAAANIKKHSQPRSQRSLYDGSDYGGDSELENDDGISPALESRMAAVEGLARRGMEENGSASDQVVQRVTEQLRDLGSQIAIENGATRLKTAHDALTAHLAHQSRTLTSLASSFSGPRPIIPDPDTIDTLLPLIQATLDQLPHSSTEPLLSLSHLTLSTRELLQHLANVSDTLHMSRQTTANASRRLKVSREQLAEWKRENDRTREGRAFIERGDWDRRLRAREAQGECQAVLDGFETVCDTWRKRLCERLGVAGA